MHDEFRSARLKVKRANKHIADLERAIGLLKETYTATVQLNPDTGFQELIHTLKFDDEVAEDLALIAGDAVHNLRSALDFAWVSLLRKHVPTANLSYAKFPIRETRDEVEVALNGININPGSHAAIFNLVVTDIQPYKDGHFGGVPYVLHNLDIDDKHLIPLGVHPVAGLEGIVVQQKGGEFVTGFGASTDALPPYVIPFFPDDQIKDKGKLSFEITLEKTGLYYLIEIVELLSKFSQVIGYSIELMEDV